MSLLKRGLVVDLGTSLAVKGCLASSRSAASSASRRLRSSRSAAAVASRDCRVWESPKGLGAVTGRELRVLDDVLRDKQ